MAEMCGLLHAATARLVGLIGQVLATGAWPGFGIRSAEHWVTWKCGVSARRARELVGMARRLPEFPETRAPSPPGSWPRTRWRSSPATSPPPACAATCPATPGCAP